MQNIIKQVNKTIEKHNMLARGLKSHVLVALSGGCDSVTLLYILFELGYQVSAIHINHNLRGKESTEDEAFCKDLCRKLGVDLYIKNYPVESYAKDQGISIEEAGRYFRYTAFEQIKKEIQADKIATAHNKNDTAETILLNLIRGTGLAGLTGIPAIRGDIIRPLNDCSRHLIENYCLQNKITYRTDSTNFDTIYTRNKMRLDILPRLININSNTIDNIKKAANNLIADKMYLEKMADQAFDQIVIDGVIDSKKFLELDSALQHRVIIKSIPNPQNIGMIHINSVMELFSKQTGKSVDLPNGQRADKTYTGVKISSQITNPEKTIENSVDFCYNVNIGDFVHIKERNIYVSLNNYKILQQNFENIYTKSFFCDTIKNAILARTKQPHDKVYIKGVGSQNLKKYFTNNKVPKEKRNPILFAVGNRVIYIPEIYNQNESSQDNSNICYLQIWRKNDNSDN